jgi:hypothetical protein
MMELLLLLNIYVIIFVIIQNVQTFVMWCITMLGVYLVYLLLISKNIKIYLFYSVILIIYVKIICYLLKLK